MTPNAAVLSPVELASSSRSSGPFTGEHLERVLVSNGVALVLIGVAWYQTRNGELEMSSGLAWLNLGLLGVAIAGIANGTWLLRQRRLVTMARVAILPESISAADSSGELQRAASVSPLVASTGMTRYHRPDCPLAIGKPVKQLTPSKLVRLRACEVCAPRD